MQVMAMPSSLALHSNFKKGCSFPSGQRLPCGRPGTTAAECLRKGCCRDEATFACYYPMDVCLADGQFIFVVPSNVAGLPINPARLMAVGRSSCKPVIANRDFAVFKFGVTECGTRSYQIGETTVYLAEVQSPIRKRILQYGIITRDIPVRLMVECRYSKSSLDLADSPVLADPLAPQASQSRLMKGWASAGYMVKSASLPALVRAKGLYGVQLRIAQDETFTKFCSEDHQPLKVLLGKPVYLELRINAPNPKATLVVHYCVAYPRSAKSALVLLYEGCPNPLDSDNISILYVAGQSQDPHVRRFEVKAFQFMDKSTNKYLNEEIYFMCSTEVCMPSQTPCKETCFDGKSQCHIPCRLQLSSGQRFAVWSSWDYSCRVSEERMLQRRGDFRLLLPHGCMFGRRAVHLVVPSNVAGLPINPARLMAVGRSSCKPVIANRDFAVFKFGVTECGTRSYQMWRNNSFTLAEVQSPIRKRILQTASLPGIFLSDETFTKFCSEDHQPLKVLLGKPVYLELRINAPNPKATLVVHYCVAYPRSAKSALVLLYEGCPNPLDSDNISILYVAGQSQDPHVRRFEVKAFQFMDKSTNKYLNEEIYFMCSTEVCMPSQTPCKETCFDGKSSSTTAADVLNSYSQLKVKHF
ncbi:hypothetical protein SRHO_G00015030 [Serrasalmus rhombeus]